MNKEVKTVIKYNTMLVVIFVFIFLLFPHLFGFRFLIVLSDSMEPSIRQGSVLVVKKEKHYFKDDIITFNQKGAKVSHRVMAVEENGGDYYFITKGDANDKVDMLGVWPEDILGKSLFSVPYLGAAIIKIRQPIIFIPFVMLPVLVFLLWEFRKVIKGRGKR